MTVPRTFPAGFKVGGRIEKHQQKNGVGRGKIAETRNSQGFGTITLYTEPSEGTTALRDSTFTYNPPLKNSTLNNLPTNISRVYLEESNGRGYTPLTTVLSGNKSEFDAESDFNFIRNMWNNLKQSKNK